MHDILLGATQEANNIIQEKLNGINFARQFVVQKDVLRSISTKGAEIADVEKKISNVCIPFCSPLVLQLQVRSKLMRTLLSSCM